MICVRRGRIRRKTARCALVFAAVALLLLCCGVNFLLSLLCAGGSVIIMQVFVFR